MEAPGEILMHGPFQLPEDSCFPWLKDPYFIFRVNYSTSSCLFWALFFFFFLLFLLWWAFVLSLDLMDNLGFLSSFQSHLILNLDSSHSFAFPLLYDLAHSKALEIWLPQSPLGISHLPPSLNSCYQLPVFPLVLTWKQHQYRGPERICFQGTHQVPRPRPNGWAPCSLPWPHPHCCPFP